MKDEVFEDRLSQTIQLRAAGLFASSALRSVFQKRGRYEAGNLQHSFQQIQLHDGRVQMVKPIEWRHSPADQHRPLNLWITAQLRSSTASVRALLLTEIHVLSSESPVCMRIEPNVGAM